MKNTSICSVEECEKARHRRSEWCHMHYERVRRHGDTDARFTFHYRSKTPEYESWHAMKQRCHNPNDLHYEDYGARGIYVYQEWRSSFQAFYDFIGPRPGAGYSIERIDNDRGCEPGNVKWATAKEQANNRRSSRMIAHKGAVHSLTEWAALLDLPLSTVFNRLKRGANVDGTRQ